MPQVPENFSEMDERPQLFFTMHQIDDRASRQAFRGVNPMPGIFVKCTVQLICVSQTC